MVRTRVAPSPTGYPHIGTIYQAVFDYSLAKKYKGSFILRIEDTDRNRFVEGSEEVIFKALDWFKLTPDEGPQQGGEYAPYRSSERLESYKKYIDQLLDKGHAYHCFCTSERLDQMRKDQQAKGLPTMYDKTCLNLSKVEVEQRLSEDTPHVVRMKIPENEKISFKDAFAGEVEFDSNLIDHQVLLKSDGYPTYHLAVVVDDYLMKVTHVIRGKEWIPSTPKHILLYRFFGWEDSLPIYIHLPLILNSDGKGKLSKRDGHSSVDYYKSEGFLPEAILNYLVNIVWNNPSGEEVYPFEEFQKAIDIDTSQVFKISSMAPRFDLKKLEWMNGEYIRRMSDEELIKRLQEFLIDHPAKEMIAPVVPLIKERIKKLSDFIPLTYFLFEEPEYDVDVFKKVKVEDEKQVLEKIAETLEGLSDSWNAESFESSYRKLAEELKISAGDIFQLIRVAFSGQVVTPPLFESMTIMGYNKALERIKGVVERYPNFQ